MGTQVTDPALLAQLNGEASTGPKPVTDPALLAQLNGQEAAPSEDQPSSLAQLGRQAALTGRAMLNGIAGLPLMAMDSGVALRNLSEQAARKYLPAVSQKIDAMTGSSPGAPYQMPSQMFEQSLNDVGVPQPQTASEKTAGFVESALTGSRMPSPTAATQAPANFVKPRLSPRDVTLAESQGSGYVVPPATTNPSVGNKMLESLGGKIATAQDASSRNQDVTNALVRKSIGLGEDDAISSGALAEIRQQAAGAYKKLRGVGDVKLDQTATDALDEIASKYTSSDLAKAIGGGNDVPKIVDAVKGESLTGAKVVDAMALLRDRANAAYGSGDKALGKAYKEVSKQLENLMERKLSGDELAAFRDARQLIAKTYSVESALNPSTGNVSAIKLAQQLAKGKPLSGDMAKAARFGQAFPKAAQEILDSGSTRNTDVALGGIAAIAEHQPWYLAYPFARLGVREGLLSKTGQRLATAGAGRGIPPGLLMGLPPAEESLAQ